ncbi:MAG: hypothetical protein JOZ69_25850 [Myxococcales bacterium]|nr:hypothetical protein [Myxococcales bacterium]
MPAGAVVAGAGVLAFAWSVLPREAWVIDDAAIYSAYARSAVHGHGLAFSSAASGAPPVEGFSSPLWMLLLVVLESVGLHGLVAAKGLGAVLGAASIAAVARFPVPPRGRAAQGLATIAFALQPSLAWWSASGLETPLAVLLVTLSLARALRGEARGAVLFGALAAVSRPEGPLFALATMAALLARGRLRWRQALLASLGLAAPFTAWLLVRLHVYGSLLPSTASKLVPDVDRLHPTTLAEAGDYFVETLRTMPGEILLSAVGLCLVARGARRPLSRAVRAALASFLVLAALLVGFVVLAHGDWMPQGRLLLPVLPACALLVVSAAPVLGASGRRALLAALFAALGLAGVRQLSDRRIVQVPWMEGQGPWLPVESPHGADPHRCPFLDPIPADGGANYYAAMLALYTQPGDGVLHLDIGQSGFLADDLAYRDPFGLVSRDEALLLRRAISVEEYRRRWDASPPVLAFLLVAGDGAELALRVQAAVADRLERDYERVAIGSWWGGYELEVRVQRRALRRNGDRSADRTRWAGWAARARGMRFDAPEYLFEPR